MWDTAWTLLDIPIRCCPTHLRGIYIRLQYFALPVSAEISE
jgi:hypothetical protein